jgi:uncharacterized protein (DUF58 family)
MPYRPLLNEYLDPEILGKLPNLEIRARFLVSGFLTGLHKSPFRGASVEFKEFRDYQPGDELKLIDWKVFARTDNLHVKLREEETNMSVYIALDKSASMNYKSPGAALSKWDCARTVAAALLLFLHRQRDAASISFIGKTLEDFHRASTKKSNFNTMMAALHNPPDDSESNIADSLEILAGLAKRRSIVVAISDFYDDTEKLENAIGKFRHLDCEVILAQVLDPRELSFDFNENVLLRELETEDEMIVSPELVKEEYREMMEDHIKAVKTLAARRDGDYILVKTNEVPLKTLGAYLNARRAKR